MQIVKTLHEIHAAMADLRARGKTALVPTMGALHDGHMSLVREARKYAPGVVLYIFVNPKQFGPKEDLATYPRTWDADVKLCEEAGVDVLYAPDAADVYPPGFSTVVSPGPIGQLLEGAHRPGFFDGVATVLAKMFTRVGADFAVFGEKDYQQLLAVKRFVRDLDIPLTVIGAPTQRAADGLAMSSRNAYLSAEERVVAPMLHATLQETAHLLKTSPMDVKGCLAKMKEELVAKGFSKVDYIALCDAETLEPLTSFRTPARLLAAAWLGKTRLIDNIPI